MIFDCTISQDPKLQLESISAFVSDTLKHEISGHVILISTHKRAILNNWIYGDKKYSFFGEKANTWILQ